MREKGERKKSVQAYLVKCTRVPMFFENPSHVHYDYELARHEGDSATTMSGTLTRKLTPNPLTMPPKSRNTLLMANAT